MRLRDTPGPSGEVSSRDKVDTSFMHENLNDCQPIVKGGVRGVERTGNNRSPHMRMILLAAPKGGVGKSTVASSLLAAARHAGLRAAGLDLDPQLSLVWWAEQRQQRGLEPTAEVMAEALRRWDEAIERMVGFDLLVIDTPPGAPEAGLQALLDAARNASLVLVPAKASEPSVRPLVGFGELLARTGVPVRYILNEVSAPALARDARAILAPTGLLADVEIPARADFARLYALGAAAADAPKVSGAGTFAKLWRYVVAQVGLTAELAA